MKIGVLAIQGDFIRHQTILTRLHIDNVPVKNSTDLNSCEGLIIPGGESTTFVKLLKAFHLFSSLKEFGSNKAVMGTCAGLITLAKKVPNLAHETLNLIDIEVERNAYGRQIDSFIDDVKLMINNDNAIFEGVFIRAPKIIKIGEGVKPLAYHHKNIVMAENEHILVSTFHPELTDDSRIHEYFLKKVKELQR